MTVHFIGAGPGAADLITVRGRDLIAACPVCLYAGSIVSPDLLQYCPPGARIVDTAPMSLDEIEAEYLKAAASGDDVARLHSGDLSVWSAVAEQIRRLQKHGITYADPGVRPLPQHLPFGRELTIPAIARLVLTRVSGRYRERPATNPCEIRRCSITSPFISPSTPSGRGRTGAASAPTARLRSSSGVLADERILPGTRPISNRRLSKHQSAHRDHFRRPTFAADDSQFAP